MEKKEQFQGCGVEGEIFLVARRLIDISVQKAGIPGFSECLEHSQMHQIQAARREVRDLHVTFLDEGWGRYSGTFRTL